MYTNDEHTHSYAILDEDWRPDPLDHEDPDSGEGDPQDGGQPQDADPSQQGEDEGDGGQGQQGQQGQGQGQQGQGQGQQGQGQGQGDGKGQGQREGNGNNTAGGSSLSPHNKDGGKQAPDPNSTLNNKPNNQGTAKAPEGKSQGSGSGKGNQGGASGQPSTGGRQQTVSRTMADMAKTLNAQPLGVGNKMPSAEAGGSGGGASMSELVQAMNTPSRISDAGHGMDDYSTFSLKGHNSMPIGQLITRMFSLLSEDAAGADKEGSDYWNMRDLMTRRIRGADVYSCQRGRERESIVLLLDTSGSCDDLSELYASIAAEAAKLGHVEIYACPNGCIESKYNPSTKQYEKLPSFASPTSPYADIVDKYGKNGIITDEKLSELHTLAVDGTISGAEWRRISEAYNTQHRNVLQSNNSHVMNSMCRFVDGTGTEGYESRVYEWFGLEGRTVVFFTDFDAQETMILNSKRSNIYWFCFDTNLLPHTYLLDPYLEETPPNHSRQYWVRDARISELYEVRLKLKSVARWLSAALGSSRDKTEVAQVISELTGMDTDHAKALTVYSDSCLDYDDTTNPIRDRVTDNLKDPHAKSGVGNYTYRNLADMMYDSIIAQGYVRMNCTKATEAHTGRKRTTRERLLISPLKGRAHTGFMGHIGSVRSEEDMLNAFRNIRLLSR